MLLSMDESEEVDTPTENAFGVVLAEVGLSMHGFSILTTVGEEPLDTVINSFMSLLHYFLLIIYFIKHKIHCV